MKEKNYKQVCETHLHSQNCDNYPFCFSCGSCNVGKEELQEVINDYFKETPYKVTIEGERLDEFESELKSFIESCGGKFTNPNKEAICAFIRCEAAKLRRIWRKEEPSLKWKPSKEQMYILNWVANILMSGGVVEQAVCKTLNSLYEDLQKL